MEITPLRAYLVLGFIFRWLPVLASVTAFLGIGYKAVSAA